VSLPAPCYDWSLCLDVGFPQGQIRSVAQLAVAHVETLSIRAVDGEHDVDPQADHTASLCRAEGMDFQLYGVCEPYGRARGAGQGRRLALAHRELGATLLPALDLELPRDPSKMTPAEAAAALAGARSYIDGVCEVLGAPPVLYTSAWWWGGTVARAGAEGAVDAAAIVEAAPLWWVADYGAGTHALRPDTYHPRLPEPCSAGRVQAVAWQAGPAGATLPWGGAVDIDWVRHLGALRIDPDLRAAPSPAQRPA